MKKKMNRISTKVFTFQFLTTRKIVIKKKIKMLFLLEHQSNYKLLINSLSMYSFSFLNNYHSTVSCLICIINKFKLRDIYLFILILIILTE